MSTNNREFDFFALMASLEAHNLMFKEDTIGKQWFCDYCSK